METIIDKLLQYQEEKNKLTFKYSGTELIPDKLKLRRGDFDSEVVKRIVQRFRASGLLLASNCLHCIKYAGECYLCNYNNEHIECHRNDSLYEQVRSATVRQRKFYNELKKLTEDIREELDDENNN